MWRYAHTLALRSRPEAGAAEGYGDTLDVEIYEPWLEVLNQNPDVDVPEPGYDLKRACKRLRALLHAPANLIRLYRARTHTLKATVRAPTRSYAKNELARACPQLLHTHTAVAVLSLIHPLSGS